MSSVYRAHNAPDLCGVYDVCCAPDTLHAPYASQAPCAPQARRASHLLEFPHRAPHAHVAYDTVNAPDVSDRRADYEKQLFLLKNA